jgi:hypothetical protein
MNTKSSWTSIALATGLALLVLQTSAQQTPRAQASEQAKPRQTTVQLRIAGMTCAACAKGLEASFKNLDGVERAAVDYKGGQATRGCPLVRRK